MASDTIQVAAQERSNRGRRVLVVLALMLAAIGGLVVVTLVLRPAPISESRAAQALHAVPGCESVQRDSVPAGVSTNWITYTCLHGANKDVSILYVFRSGGDLSSQLRYIPLLAYSSRRGNLLFTSQVRANDLKMSQTLGLNQVRQK